MSDPVIDTVTVSRKTPRDGKLEVNATVALRLATLGSRLVVAAAGSTANGAVEEMACTCAKAAGAGHVHHFLVSEVLRGLAPDERVAIQLDPAGGLVTVATAAPTD